jgi:hypothetical protein
MKAVFPRILRCIALILNATNGQIDFLFQPFNDFVSCLGE